MNWKQYTIPCLKGAETNTLYHFQTWATSWQDAKDQARESGYIPCYN